MRDLSFSLVDLLVVLTVVTSMALAIWRGFVRETLSIFAWAAAAFATLYFGPAAASLVHARYSGSFVAPLIAYGAVFLLVLIPLSFVSYRFSEGVKHSPIGPIDRSLGAAFGVVRGLAIVGLSYLVFSMIVPIPSQQGWLTQAKLFPVIQSSGDVLLSLVPARAGDRNVVETPAPVSDTPVPKPRPSATRTATHHTNKAYGANERHALDKLIQSTGSGGNNKP
jgi:membrane protein required for colicin V production